jgi:hypothetical protein
MELKLDLARNERPGTPVRRGVPTWNSAGLCQPTDGKACVRRLPGQRKQECVASEARVEGSASLIELQQP